jgi:hypothetical protein
VIELGEKEKADAEMKIKALGRKPRKDLMVDFRGLEFKRLWGFSPINLLG